MEAAKISKQQVSSCRRNRKFVSSSYMSKEEFRREYSKLNYDKLQTAELFLQVFAKLEEAVSEGNIDDFKNLRCLIKYASQMKDGLNLKDYYNHPNNPIRNTNLVILACKKNKQEILNYLFDNDSEILNDLCMDTKRNIILPDHEDDECHNAFYYAIRSSNVELLDTLINIWPGNYFNLHSDELDVILSKAYEELKFKYVPLSDEMEIFIVDKLLNLRFFSNTSIQKRSCRCDLNAIKKRIELVLENINLLKAEYSNTETVDDKFLFVTKFIAQNIHILKQQLKSTYDRLPWEEMEFYLISFVSAYTKQQEINLFYFSILNKKKILNQLHNFGRKLEEEKMNMETMDSIKISGLPKLKRDIVIAMITKNNPEFEELYNDYQQIRDVYSLEKVNSNLKLALSTNCSEKEGQLIILRVLQVIGENLKNTLESPKLSNTTCEFLLLSLPKHTREVVKDLRNSLSHAYSLHKRTEIEKNADVNFFTDIQNDIKKIDDVVTDILYSNRMKAMRIVLEKFVDSKTFDEMKEVLESLNNLELNEITPEYFKMNELLKLEKFVEELSNIVTDKTDYEKELFGKINNIIRCTENKSVSTEMNYIRVFAFLISLRMTYNDNNNNHNSSRILKTAATKALEVMASEIKHIDIEEIAKLSMKIFQSVKLRIPRGDDDEINRLISKIYYIVAFEVGNIKSIEKLREKLSNKNSFMPAKKQKKTYSITEEEYNNQLAFKLSELKIILNNNNLSGQLIGKHFSYKEKGELLTVIKMFMLDIMSILSSLENYLEDNLFFLDDNTPLLIGKCLRNHLAHGNALVDILFDPSLAVILNARKLAAENIIKNSRKIGKFVEDDPLKLEDKHNKSLAIITNQKRMFVALEKGNLEDLKDCLKKGADLNARDFNLWTTLHFAAKGPSLEVVKFILDHNLSVNVKNSDSQSPLHIAAAYDRRDIVQFLVKNTDLYIDNKDSNGKTPLYIAAQEGNIDIVDILLKNNANPNMKDLGGYSPLHCAVKENHIDVVQTLLKKEIHVDHNEVMGGFTSLHIAAENGHLEMINFLLKNGANINAKSDKGATALHPAALNGYLEVVNTLILNNADINARCFDGYTALHCAVENGHKEIANILLKYGANANVSDKIYNCTPLQLAARDGYDGIVKILLKNKANINVASIEGMTALHFAVQSGHLDVVTTLLEHDANSNAKTVIKDTPLHYAAARGYKEIVDLLIKNGAEVNSRSISNFTPLFVAIMRCHTDVVDLLIKHRAEINCQDITGNIPLHAAVMCNNKDIIDLLIKNKADVNAKNIYGIMPLHLAAANCNTDIIDLLIRNKAKVNGICNNNITPLHLAICYGRVDATTFLIKNGAEVGTIDKLGYTLLQSAVTAGHKDVVNTLIKNKADVNDFGHIGSTALHIAAGDGNYELVEILIRNGANVNAESKNNKTPLTAAVKSNCKKIVEVLISNGANVNAANGAALSSAVIFGYKDIIKVLLDNKANIHINCIKDKTLLHLTAASGETEIVDVLIAKGANINATDKKGITPLHCAVSAGHKDTIELLLLKGANVNAISTEGTPLHLAIEAGGNINIVKILLNNGADVSIKDSKNRVALELAVVHTPPECVKLLLLKSKKTDINAKGNDNWTVLHIAAQEGNLEMIKCLIDKGSDINAKNSAGSKPIHIAARDGFKDVVEFFLSKGCSIHDLGAVNQTLLHYAAINGQLEVAKYLISKGLDINAQDNNGVSPMHIAALHGHESIIELLLQNGAIYNIVDSFGVKPVNMANNAKICMKLVSTEKLFDAVKRNNTSEVEKYIKAGACINAKHAATKGHNGTALHYAAWKGYDEIINILLQNKANPNITGDKGFTPLHYAVKFSHLKVVMVLLSKGAIYNAVSDEGKTPLDFAVDKNIIKLLKLVSISFKNVTINNTRIINDLNKIKDINTMKAIMSACNKEHQSLIVTAMINKFSKIKELKEVLQEDVSSHIAVGTILASQENFQQGLITLQRVLEKRKEIFGPDNPATLDVQNDIAKIIYKQGAYEEAANMSDEIFQKQKEMFGFDYEDTLSTRSMYALILHRQGKNKEALDIFEEVYKKQKQILRSDHEDILNSQLHMALVLCALREYEKALELNKIVYEKRKKLSGENDPNAIRALNNIAMVLYCQDKYEEALKTYQLVFEKKKMIFGVSHSDTLRTLDHIAKIYHAQKRYNEALRTTKEILDCKKNLFGEDHPYTLHTQHSLAQMFLDQGKYINALKVCKECLDKAKAVLGPSHQIVSSFIAMIEQINIRYTFDLVDLSKINEYFQRDINTAASNGNIQLVRRMLKDGIDINDHDFEGRAPLHFAVSNGHVDIVNLLLEKGADVSQVTKKGNTPLHIAASKNDKEIVEILLEHIDRDKLCKFVNAKTTGSGATSLHIAATNGFLDIIKSLLAHGATYNVRNKNGETPFDLSRDPNVNNLFKLIDKLFRNVKNGHVDVIDVLKNLKHDEFLAIVNARDIEESTLLQVAVSNKQKNIVSELLKMIQHNI